MAWACMVASGTGLLIFISNVTNDSGNNINIEVYKNIGSAHLQRNASILSERNFILQQTRTQNTLPTQQRTSSGKTRKRRTKFTRLVKSVNEP